MHIFVQRSLFCAFLMMELLCRTLHSSSNLLSMGKERRREYSKAAQKRTQSFNMQINVYKYYNMQTGTHRNVQRSVRYLLHSADYVEKRNTTVTFSDCLLHLSCDKRAGNFLKICIFSAKQPLNLLTSVWFCDTLVTQELQM